jgi:hypothetical protein
MFIYTTRDRQTGGTTAAATYGIYRDDWTPKTAQATVRAGASVPSRNPPNTNELPRSTIPHWVHR